MNRSSCQGLRAPKLQITQQQSRRARLIVRSQESQGDAFRKAFKRMKAAMPVVGLISRLTTAEGGAAGTDRLEYPEYSRSVYEAAPTDFQIAVAELQTKYGKAAQRKYILFCLWMTKYGVGVIPSKNIVDAAKRVKISQDLEFEMDRFNSAAAEALKDLRFIEPPKGSPQQYADVGVDAICRLVGIKDGEALSEDVAVLVKDAVVGGFYDEQGLEPYVEQSIASRTERAGAYAN